MLTAYERFARRTGVDALAPRPEVAARLIDAPFGDGASIHPIPLVLTVAERDLVADATEQRARALARFFVELARGEGGLVPHGIVDRVLADHGVTRDELRRCWSGWTDVCFTYAPDLVRADGAWRVLEDNIGCIGGLADSYYCQEAYLAAAAIDPRAYGEEVPDLCAGVRAFLGDADPGAVVVELGCDGQVDGQVVRESARRAALLERLELAIDRRADAAVSHVVNFVPSRRAFDRVTMLNGPHVELLGDKRFLPYVEAMVTSYLGEVPRLRALPTRAIDAIGEDDAGVAKHARGAGGTAVYFLDDAAERAEAERAITAAGPGAFVVQDLAPPGPASDPLACVELRPFAFVAGDRVHASRIPSARMPRPDRRRANLGYGARYVAVLVQRA